MRTFFQDLRYAARLFAGRPGLTLAAVITIALAIGAVTTNLSVADAVLLRPFPYEHAERLMLVWRTTDASPESPFSFPTVEDLRERNRVFDSLSVYVESSLNLTGSEGDPERLGGLLVSADFAATLGVEPIAGRGFTAADEEPGAPPTVMMSAELWQRRFGGEAALVGRTVTLNASPYTVIGIYPAGLRGEGLNPYPVGDFWIPLELFRPQMPQERENRNGLFLVGRRAAGVSVEAVEEDLGRLVREIREENPITMSRSTFSTLPLVERETGPARPVVTLLLAAAGFVLLIACANLANLILSHGAGRRRELAVRSVLGAGRGRLIRQLLTETLLLATIGGGLGVALAYGGTRLLPVISPAAAGDSLGAPGSPAAALARSPLELDLRVLAVAALIAFAGLVPAALLPAFRTTDWRGDGGRVSTQLGLRRLLVGVELAGAAVLLIGTALMLASLLRLSRQPTGFVADERLTLQVSLPLPQYEERTAFVQFYDRALESLAALPGVVSASATSTLPLSLGTGNMSIVVAGDRPVPPVPEMDVTVFQMVSPGYFEGLGVALRRGRLFRAGDDAESERVAILSESLARQFWPDPDVDPVGKRIAFEFAGGAADPQPLWRTIVGVVADVRDDGLRLEPRPIAFAPVRQPIFWFEGAWPTMALVLESETDPDVLVGPARAALLALDPQLPVHDVRRYDDIVAAELGEPRLALVVLGAFGGVAAILALVGIYGILSHLVASRTRELGTRCALGASPRQILGRMLVQTLVLVVGGLAAGLAAAALLSRFMTHLLYEVEPLDPILYAATAVLLGLGALAATALPAWRAAHLDPAKALRHE